MYRTNTLNQHKSKTIETANKAQQKRRQQEKKHTTQTKTIHNAKYMWSEFRKMM